MAQAVQLQFFRTRLTMCLLVLVERTLALRAIPLPVPMGLRRCTPGTSSPNLGFFEGQKGPSSSFPPCSREAAVPLTPAWAGAASPHPPHRNHKFTVGLLRSPPILRSCYLPRLAAYLGAWGWLSAMAELALHRDQTLSCYWN